MAKPKTNKEKAEYTFLRYDGGHPVGYRKKLGGVKQARGEIQENPRTQGQKPLKGIPAIGPGVTRKTAKAQDWAQTQARKKERSRMHLPTKDKRLIPKNDGR